MHELGEHSGHWCAQGAHDACTGSWRTVRCSCTCHGHTIDLVLGKHDLTIEDSKTLRAFAAFLRHAGARPGGGMAEPVRVHPEWHAWLNGTGPTPDPDSEVGPADEPVAESCGGNHGVD